MQKLSRSILQNEPANATKQLLADSIDSMKASQMKSMDALQNHEDSKMNKSVAETIEILESQLQELYAEKQKSDSHYEQRIMILENKLVNETQDDDKSKLDVQLLPGPLIELTRTNQLTEKWKEGFEILQHTINHFNHMKFIPQKDIIESESINEMSIHSINEHCKRLLTVYERESHQNSIKYQQTLKKHSEEVKIFKSILDSDTNLKSIKELEEVKLSLENTIEQQNGKVINLEQSVNELKLELHTVKNQNRHLQLELIGIPYQEQKIDQSFKNEKDPSLTFELHSLKEANQTLQKKVQTLETMMGIQTASYLTSVAKSQDDLQILQSENKRLLEERSGNVSVNDYNQESNLDDTTRALKEKVVELESRLAEDLQTILHVQQLKIDNDSLQAVNSKLQADAEKLKRSELSEQLGTKVYSLEQVIEEKEHL
ncbi:hypothetical protein BC833DRAFT_561696, partial [Globomyces pollinis-pini]